MASAGPNPKSPNNDSDLMDKDISFEQRDMHKSWPMVKGCALLILTIVVFVYLSMWIFKAFKEWF